MRLAWLQLLLGRYKRRAHNQTFTLGLLRVGVLLLLVFGMFFYTRAGAPTRVEAATSSTINFQARLLTSAGNLVPDGTYNVEFKLYDSLASGASAQGACSLNSSTDDCWWVETRTGANKVTVKNGYFSVYLGSVTAFGSNINWDQEHWLTLNIGGSGAPTWDGEMTPRTKLTAVPYAFKAGQLAKTTGGNTSTLDFAAQTGSRSILLPDESGTLCIQDSSDCGFATGAGEAFLQGGNSFGATAVLGTDDAYDLVLQTGGVTRLNIDDTGSATYTGGTTGDALTVSNSTSTGDILVAQDNSTDVFVIANGGTVLAKNSTDSTAAFQIQNTGSTPLFTADTTNSRVYVGDPNPDTNGALLVLDTKNDAGDPTGVNGGMYYNSSTGRFRCYQDNDWVDCIGGGSSGSASASFLSGLQNVPANATGTPVETLVFTSATAVSNTAGVTGFTAPADGSFRTCLIKNNAAITAGTLDLRWRVNGVSVGSSACQMDATTNRQTSSVLNPGVVNFSAGDTIGIAFDTSAGFLPVTAEFTVYWSVEYTGAGGGGGGGSGDLQDAYDNSVAASILAADNKDIEITLPDTASDPNFIINILSGSAGELKVQDNGADVFTVNGNGDVFASGGLTLGDSALSTAGTIRWTGLDFEGYDGSNWLSLTGGGGAGPGLGSNYVNIVKQANEVVNNSIALQDDNELTFSVGPNQEWTYRFVVQANAAAAADLRFAVTAPAGANCFVSFSDPEGATAGGQTACGVSSVSIPGNGAVDLYEITGSVTTGGTGGTVTLQWAQFTLNASDATVYTGSYVTAFRSIGAGSSGQPFVQGGNAFGVTALLGNSDNNDLSIITNGNDRIYVESTGNVGIGDNSPAALLTVGTADAFQVNASGNVLTAGTITSTGTINTTGGVIQTNSTTRIDNSGNLSNILNIALTGSISGGTTYSGSGNINTTGGAIQTNSTTRIDNSGNLTNIGNVTGTGALTLSSGGAGDLVLDSASNTLIIAANDTTLQRTAAGSTTLNLVDGSDTSFVIDNSGAGVANLNLNDGGLQTAGTTRLTNGGALQNITGLDVVGTANINNSGTAATAIGNATGLLSLIGNASSSLVLNGTTLDVTELSRLDGKDAALVDANDAVNTAITGTGALNVGSITSGFGSIDNADTITGTTLNGTTGINTGAGAGTQRIDNNGNLTNILALALTSSISGGTTYSGSGNINTTGGSIQTNSTTRIDNVGALQNITSLTLSGAISGGTTYSGSGNINSTGGAIQTNSTTRIDNTGNLTNIGNLTATGAITIASSGAGNDITIDGADQLIIQDSTVFNTDADFVLNGTENIAVTSDLAGSVNVLSFIATPSSTAGSTSGIFLQQANSGNANGLDAAITIDNADTDLAITDGLIVTSAAGGITDAIDVSDSDIVNAINVGDNNIIGTSFTLQGTTATIDFSEFDVSGTTGSVTIDDGGNAGQLLVEGTNLDIDSLNFVGAGTITSSAGSSLTIDSGTTGQLLIGTDASAETINIGTGAAAKAVTLGSTNTTSNLIFQAGTGTATGDINVGDYAIAGKIIDIGSVDNAATTTIRIATAAAAQTITVGSTNTTSATTIQAGTGNLTLNSGAGTVLAKNSTNSQQAFQVQNSSSANILNINTLTSGLNLLANSNFEANINGWSAKGTPTLSTPVWDNTASNAQFGNATLELSTDAVTDGVAYSYPFTASTQYSASFFAKTSSGTATFIIGRQENGIDVETGCSNASVTTTWTQFTCTFTTGATINGTSNLYFRQQAAGTPTIFIDGVTLVTGATALAFVNPAGSIQIDANYGNLAFNAANLGELQQTQLNSNALPAARRYGASAYGNGYVYYTGGDNGGAQSTVYYSKLNADGSTGAFNTTTALTTGGAARYGHTSVIENGYLYVIGGDTGGTAQTSVYFAKLNNDGTVASTWRSTNPLPGAREFHSTVAINGYIYVIGGETGGTAQSTVYYAKANADGGVGAWQTGTALTTGAAIRRQHTSVFANGYLYVMGGYDATTAQTTVYYNSVNSDGSLGAGWTATTSLPGARRYATSTVANGYVYVLGGCSDNNAACTTPTNTVYYAKLNNNGTIGIWQTAANGIPAVRNGHSLALVNGYIYTIGGYNGSATQSTVYYASTPRTLFGGALDLVGLGSQTLSDPSGAGSIVAGNIRGIGRLQIEGSADINGGLSVDSSFNLNSVSAATGQSLFNINNNTSNSIFDIKHMAANFGGLATTGAFVDRNSYWGEEFNVVQTNNCSRTATTNSVKVRGDFGFNAGAACTAGNGSISFSSVEAGPGTPTSTASTLTGSYGVERLTSTGVVTAGSSMSSLLYLSTTAAGTINGQWASNNLPVFTAKVRPSLVNSGSNARFFVGLSDKGAATGTMPNNGIFFTNCSTFGGAPTCTNTNWQGVVTSGGAIVGAVQACTAGAESGTINTTNFNYLRIEVRANNDIHFFVDTDTSTGVSEVECGTGVTGTGPGATALTLMLESAFMTNTVTTENLDIDFVRIWQDDPPEVPQSTPPLETLSGSPSDGDNQSLPQDAYQILEELMNVTDPDVQAQNDGNIRTGQLIVSGDVITRSLTSGKVRINKVDTSDDLAQLLVGTGFAENKGLVIQARSGQIGNLFEAQDSNGQALVFIDAEGRLGLGNADSTGGIVLRNSNNTSQTLLFTAGASSDVSLVLPGENGTLCVQRSGSCGFAGVGSEVGQTDSSNFDSISIDKTSSSGNLLSLKRNGQGVLTVDNSGGLDIVTDNGAALEVHGTNGLSYFRVDTNGGLVQIGSGEADSRGILLVLDSKNTAGDPNGVNGASYYNGSANKFRCFQNGRWQDCLPSGYNQYTMTTLQQQWTDQPAAETELPSISHLFLDLTVAQEYRLVLSRPAGSAASGASCRAQYATNEAGSWTDLDEVPVPGLAIDGPNGTKVSSWSKIKTGAKAEVFLRVSCRGGDGAADPQFGAVSIQVR